MGRRALRAAALGVGLIGSLFLGGCAQSQAQHSTPARQPAGLGLPKQVGALAGRTWPAGSLRPGMLLYDDGTHLWSMRLDGSRRLIWRHPAIGLVDMAVAPDGRELAFAVTMRVSGTSGAGLWDMRPDGSIRLVDTVPNYGSILTPTFMRVPEAPDAADRLYGIRGSQEIDSSTGRPTRYVDLRSNDYFDQFGSATRLGEWEEVANSDVDNGVAWLTPRWYVAAVGQQDTLPSYEMKRFEVQCEFYGSHRTTSGTAIAESTDETPWRPVALDNRRMLVLRSRDLRTGLRGNWFVLDALSGRLTRTALVSNGTGVWQSVRPSSSVDLNADPHCNRTAWTYP